MPRTRKLHTGRELLRRMAAEGWTLQVTDPTDWPDAGFEATTSAAGCWGDVTALADGAFVTFVSGARREWALLIPGNGAEDCLSDYSAGGRVSEVADELYASWDGVAS